MIAGHLVERPPDCPNVLDESTMLDPMIQESISFYGGKPRRKAKEEIIQASSDRKMSSDIFSFRLVSKQFAEIGLKVFLQAANTERWKHYSTLNMPPKLDKFEAIASVLRHRQGMAEAVDEAVFRILPDYAMGPSTVSKFLGDVHIDPNDEVRDVIRRDADRIWLSRYDEQAALVHHAQSYKQLLGDVLVNLQTVTIEYNDFIAAKTLLNGENGLLRQAFNSEAIIKLALDVTETLPWTSLRLLNIGALDLRAQDKGRRNHRDTLAEPTLVESRLQKLEITYSWRDDTAREGPDRRFGPERHTEGSLFLDSFRNLREFSVTVDPHWMLKPATISWLKKAFTYVHWPHFRKLTVINCRTTSLILVNFLKAHRETLEEVDLRDIWTLKHPPSAHTLEDVVDLLGRAFDMKDITPEEHKLGDLNRRHWAHYVRRDDDVIMED
jgi:hypothetical protein